MNNREGPLPIVEGRECGSCYACCVHLGIEALKKHSGAACTYLSGASGPDKRCSIYSHRPDACDRFQCAWKQGIGADNARPNESGILLVFYEIDGKVAATISIVDESKCGTIEGGPLASAIKEILSIDEHTEIRIINHVSRKLLLFKEGRISGGWLMRPAKGDYEALVFAITQEDLGRYLCGDNMEEIEARIVPGHNKVIIGE